LDTLFIPFWVTVHHRRDRSNWP